ncbi:MAG: endonuclease/exonuclease/phosphatase family protein [Hyphomicrobiaceae bacterium]
MRLASYNVENLFTRAKALNLDTWAQSRSVLEHYAEINAIFENETYADADKTRILQLLKLLGIDKKDDGGQYVQLRQNRGQLLKRGKVYGLEIVAKGRNDWTGWVEMKTELVNETATRNTAQVVRDINADVLGVIECEGRAALLQFSQKLLPSVGATPYAECMLIDGNDTRGIDVGLLTKPNYKIGWMRSHVDDIGPAGSHVFSRDCPEFAIWTPSGATVWVLVNHLKSKGYGAKDASDARRWLQSETIRTIYERLKKEGAEHIVVMGDMNDSPDAETLAPLLRDTDLKDASTHPTFKDGGRPGTYQSSSAREKLDYILLSPSLYSKMSQGGNWRNGVWGGKNGTLWPIYPEMTSSYQAASDHAAIWCDVEI